MAEVVGSIAEEIDALGSQALEKVGKLWGLEHELTVLKNIVTVVNHVLEDAEKQYYQSSQVQLWVDGLKEVFYDAQDVLEEINIEAIRREMRGHNELMKEVRTFFSNANQLAFYLKMSYKLRTVRKRIYCIKADRSFHLEESREREPPKRRETHTFVRGQGIIGRDDDKKKIINFLLNSDVQDNVSVLSIVGICGLGKTALAICVYTDELVYEHFQLTMWVCVSHDFDIKNIMKSMITIAKSGEVAEVAMDQLQRELREMIDGKRCLLVLDDLWNEEPEIWLRLRALLEGGAKGSKILITTRLSLKISDTCLSYPLSYLSESASVELLLRCSDQKAIEEQDMLDIAKEIASKCYGVPLILRTVGSLLYFKRSKEEWLHFKDYELSKVSKEEDCIISTLRLSYDHLPSHLKECFAFCSLFPRNYDINKRTLINLWVAQGFIRSLNKNQHLEDIAHEYLMDLLWRNFFQDFQKDPFTNKETCKMPALMHDLACSVARTNNWVAGDDVNSIHEKTHHICDGLSSNLIGRLPKSCSRLKTFLLAPTYREIDQREQISEADLCQLIKSFKRLRILDLHATILQKVPRSICKLKFLTYLDLSHNNALKRLPNSITRLQNLQTLNLQGCFALKELPRGIRKLVRLRNLDIDYCYSLSYLPYGLGQLSALHMLTRFILPNGQALAKNYCRLKELNTLNNIRGRLCIENLGSVKHVEEESWDANLIAKESLESLALKWGNFDTYHAEFGNREELLWEGLRPHPNLKKLMISRYTGESFPDWLIFLPNLVEVRFNFCGRWKRLPPLSLLPNLKTLELWGLTELEEIDSCDPPTSAPSFPKLSNLEIHHCTKLKDMPLTPHLEGLTLREVNGVLVNQIIGLNELKSLHISQIKTLRCLPEKCLESLTLLESLIIGECEELDLSKNESGNMLDLPGFKNLRFLGIHGVPKLASLPPWLLQASNLKHISIKECFNLKELPEQMDALQSLQKLEIIRCPSLTSLPESMQRLHSLSHLTIVGCPKLEERCKQDTGVDWYKISHIRDKTYKLKYYEHRL